jgi:riboflavin kinase/FMN adenylyltransferase
MRVLRHLEHVATPLGGVVLTLGNFDGVHLGHQAIVRQAVAEARADGGQAVALTFHPHPIAVLKPEKAPPLIQPLHDRLAILGELGVDVAVVQRFTRAFAAQAPDAFVRDRLLRHLDVRHVVVGWNVSFGRDRAGNVDTLRALGARHGFQVDAIGPVRAGEDRVSSSAVRRLLGAGDVRSAARLLGRLHRLRGRVVGGERRGRQIGFPTANLHLKPGVLLPLDGVYAVVAHVGGRRLPAVMNVGVRPTFGVPRRTVEVHVLDWSGDLYGRWLEVELAERLRGEQRFTGPDALKAAIAADVARARTLLAPADRE